LRVDREHVAVESLVAGEGGTEIEAGSDVLTRLKPQFASFRIGQIHEGLHRRAQGCEAADAYRRKRRLREKFASTSGVGEDRRKFAGACFHQCDGKTFPAGSENEGV